ncbi:MAG: carbohydrate kinase family protein [Candidatus Bathyarchaeota archaeon]|jgi:ribokinase
MKFDVIGFGALNVDKLYKVNKIAGEDEESFVLGFRESPGGSAANTIAGLARLGLKTGYVGKVANDPEGKLLLNDFKRAEVDIDGTIIAPTGRSGVVIGFVDMKGQRALYVDSGVNDTLEFKEIGLQYVRGSGFLHLTSFVGEKPFKAQKKLVEELSNVKVSLDPGEIYARKGLAALEALIERSFVVFPNENEVRLLTGKGLKEGSKILIKKGASIVAAKLGGRGCYVTDSKESHLVKPRLTEVVDTTGAGDAFCAGFLYGLIERRDLYTCAELGNFVASRCITETGARRGLPKLSEMEKLEFSR